MRIATFNIESLEDGAKASASLEARASALRPLLVQLRADILCLQEVNAQHVKGHTRRTLSALDKLLFDTPYAAYHRSVTHRPDGHGLADVHNLVTLSRHPILASEEISMKLLPPLSYGMTTAGHGTPPICITFDRPVLKSTIALPAGTELDVFNLHLRAPLAVPIPGQKEAAGIWRTVPGWAEGYFLAGLKRSRQALELRFAVDRIFDADPLRRIVVAGDFNAGALETPVRIVTADSSDTGNDALGDRSLRVLDDAIPFSRRFSIVHAGRRQMPDHILASRAMSDDFDVIEVLNADLRDEAVDRGPGAPPLASNHAPLVATFEFA